MPTPKNRRRVNSVPGFRRSANIETDTDSPLSRYTITTCAKRALDRVVATLAGKHSGRAWTLTGPYGSGKSSFALFLSALLGTERTPHHRESLASIRHASPDLAQEISKIRRGGRVFVPVLIAGAREPLSTAVLRAARAALSACSSRAAKALLADLDDKGRKASRDPVQVLAAVHDCVVNKEPGVSGTLVIFDELGKLLEFAAMHPRDSDVHVLQRLAEHATRTDRPMLLLGILHQDFAGYARDLPAADRAEWEKVRGRFEDIAFDEPADETLRLLADTWQRTAPPGIPTNAQWRPICESAAALSLVPRGMEKAEATRLLTACRPLHPLAALLLGPVFKRFGQNERSAFSFLQSSEPFSLRDFIARSSADAVFGVADLYDYLLATIGDALLSTRDGKRWAEAIDLERRLADLDRGSVAVLKTISLLGIVGRWYDLAPSPEVVRYSMTPAMRSDDVDMALDELKRRSAIVLRKYNNSLSLWEGSDIDVEGRLSAARSAVPVNAGTVGLLREHFHARPVIARRHSFSTGTLRHFAVEYTTWDELAKKLSGVDSADGRLLLVIDDRSNGREAEVIAAVRDQPEVVLVIPSNSREIGFLAQEVACLAWVRHNTPALAGDSAARRELEARDGDVRRRLQGELSSALWGHGARCIHQGRDLDISTPRDLNEALSRICDDLYGDAPVIRNEIINRREPSSSAAAARRNLIEKMLLNPTLPDLGIVKNPPERSVYLSVLRSLGLHTQGSAGWHFTTDGRCAKQHAGALFKAIREFFERAEQEQRPVLDLFRQLQSPPFGIRAGVLPIIVGAALIAHEAEVALYEDGAFVPQLTVPIFERLIKEPGNYRIRRWRVTGVRSAVFLQLADMLGKQGLPDHVGRQEVLEVVKPLLRFVRKLDKYTLNTRSLQPETIAVRDALLTAREPDQLLFTVLPTACGISPFESSRRDRGADVDRYRRALQGAVTELQQAYERLIAAVHASLTEAFGGTGTLAETRLTLTRRARTVRDVAHDPDLKNFVTRLTEDSGDDREWIESLASLLAGVPAYDWRDEDRARFDVALMQRVRRLRALEVLVSDTGRGAPDPDMHSIRLGITATAFADREIVLHVRASDMPEVDGLAEAILDRLGDRSLNGHRDLALAAIAKAAHALLAGKAQQQRQPQEALS